ncbi:MAG: hypothetical protein WBA67_13300 [Jannaschia sp.]
MRRRSWIVRVRIGTPGDDGPPDVRLMRAAIAAMMLVSGASAAEPLSDPFADTALDCAALSVLLGQEPAAIRDALNRAVTLESAATGAFSERLLPMIQVAFAERLERLATLPAAEVRARADRDCPKRS